MHVYFKIEEKKLTELLVLYKRYCHRDNNHKADFINEPYIKLMFRNFETELAKKKRKEEEDERNAYKTSNQV